MYNLLFVDFDMFSDTKQL